MAKPLRLLFAGTPLFAERHLDALLQSPHEVLAVLTQPDRPAGRGKKLQQSPVKARALAAGIEVLQPATLRDADIQASLAEFEADVMIVVAYGLILPQAVLDIPRFGCLNVHASLLPRWRGAAPIQRAIEAGDDESGVTIMAMEAGLDTGPMLLRTRLSIGETDTGETLHDRLATLGPSSLLQVLEDIESRLSGAEQQDDALATYAHKITKADCELDWQQPADVLARKIRAFNPGSVCFSHLHSQRVKIWAAEVEPLQHNALPGTLLSVDPDSLLVACGDQALRITRAQFPGGRAMAVHELLNGKKELLTPGTRFTLLEQSR